jgi:RNA polymerase sigma-70 factor (ECF subfamily)
VIQLGEEELIKKYKETGEQKFVADLYQPYMPLVYGLCLKYLKNTAESEDAAMDVYINLLKKLKIHEVNNFKSWLYVVAKNHCLDRLRSKASKYSKENEANLMYSEQIYHPEYEEDEEELKRLQDCLRNLPDNQKRSIDMFYYKKNSYKEIAEITGWTWSNIRSYIQNGRRNLKLCMEANEK